MDDTPEIPEAKDPFERRVAVAIAMLAALLAFVSMRGDNAKTDAGLRTTEASNQWSFFQAKKLRSAVTSNSRPTTTTTIQANTCE